MHTHPVTDEPVVAPQPKAPVAWPLPPAQILNLQRTAGNQAVSRVLAREPAPVSAEPATPQASQAPPKLTAIQHEGQYIATGVDGCYDAMLRVAGAKGAAEANAWASRFSNMGAIERASLEAQHDPELVSGTIAAMNAAEAQFDDACTQFLMTFETRAGNVADEMLTTSETTVKAEQERLGLKDSQFGHGANAEQLEKLRAAAALLGAKRQEVDALARTSIDAQHELERAVRTDPFGIDRSAREKADQARKTWSEAEKSYDQMARRETAQQPALAMYTTGGGAAAKLASISGTAPDDPRFLAHRLQHEVDEKLANIAKVRGALGGRFKPLKQPPVVRMTKQSLSAEPWQSRLVDDHIREVEAAEADSELMWTVLSLGLGLLAAIPTGGSSLVAGVAAAGAIGAAGVSAYHAYDELQDAALQDAAAGTDFDKAHAIAESEPDYFWLALDIVGAIADVAQAGAAFKALRATMRSVNLTDVASLQKLASECEAAKLSPTARGQVFGAALADAGGDMTVTLEQMLEVFKTVVPPPGEEKWFEYAHQMAEHMIAEGKVITLRPGHELEDATAWMLRKDPTLTESHARDFGNDVLREMEGKTGAYFAKNRQDLIVMRTAGTPESVASVFVHEITHRKQKLMKVLGKMTDMERELSAFASQRDFLKLVPLEAIPQSYHWLRAATDDDIYFNVYKAYGMNRMTGSKVSDIWMQMLQELRS